MRLRGIIINISEHQEHHLLVTVYTREMGKLKAVAKSAVKASSKQASHLDLFNAVDFTLIEGNGYPIIASAHSYKTHAAAKSSLPSLACGLFILEFLDVMTFEHDPDRSLWNISEKVLEYLDEKSADITRSQVSSITASLQSSFIKVLGYSNENFSSQATLEEVSGKKFGSLRFIKDLTA